MKRKRVKGILFYLGINCFGVATGSLIASGFEPPYTVAQDFGVLGLILLLISWRLRA